MLILIPIWVFLAVMLVMAALMAMQVQPLKSRLYQYTLQEELTAYEMDVAKPFLEKVLLPLLQRLGGLVGQMTPARVVADTEKRLQQAGYPLGLTINTFLLGKVLMILLLPVPYLASLVLTANGQITPFQIVALLGLFYLGSRAADWWLDHQVNARKNTINRALPDALDFIVICSEAGLALEGAMARVVERMKGPLAEEFRRTLGEISLGKRRREALRALADRTEAHDLVSFIAAIVQADQTGISVGNVLQVQAADLRLRRRQRAEKEGREAPLKMLFPNIFFIFPATLIVLIGPAALKIIDQMLTEG